MIVDLNFTAEFVVARKIENIFKIRHQRNENIFYDDLVTKLFENKLHCCQQNYIYYALRGNKNRQAPMKAAIQTARLSFEKKWNVKIQTELNIHPQSPAGEPCLQIADYMN